MASLAQINHQMTPADERPNNSGSQEQGSAESNRSRSPLNGWGIFRSSGAAPAPEEPRIKANGQPAKRRGPKPDAKPALTRRQELNRQAQRTHRERKEQYIKQLEQEVIRLREVFANACYERDAFAVENQKLKELLAHHGISFSDISSVTEGAGVNSGGTFSGSYPPSNQPNNHSPPPGSGQDSGNGGHNVSPVPVPPQDANGVDYDQTGIDFVLALERPCMDHLQMLCVKSLESEGDFSGHALMATCPPSSHLIERPEVQYPHKTPDGIHAQDLMKLLDLSNRLPLDGEITPVMAWAFILRDPRLSQLTPQDFAALKEELLAKVRCYGFGAVLEEFEVSDALEATLARQTDHTHAVQHPMVSAGSSAAAATAAAGGLGTAAPAEDSMSAPPTQATAVVPAAVAALS